MRNRSFRSLLLVVALIAALWPVWRWMVARIADGTGDAWGLLSLATAAALLCYARPRTQEPLAWTGLPTMLLLLYAVTYALLPPLLRAGIAMAAVAAAWSALWLGRRMHVALLGLLLLSLPVIASLNFYLGYPLRAFAGTITQALLQMTGFAVIRDGALLQWNGQTIAIDAPCSGIKMLWAGLYLSCTLAAFARLDNTRTVLLSAFAFAAVVISNVLRSTALFFVEAGIVAAPEQLHAGVGVVVFAVAALIIAMMTQHLRQRSHAC